MTSFFAFIGVSILVIVTPGPDTAITIRNALCGGRWGGVFTALGIASGQMIWAMATSAGLVALLIASEPLFLALKYAGAAYLIFLGFQALREAFRDVGPKSVPADEAPRRLSALSAFRQGVISDLGNPKMAVFFASLLPQFVPTAAPVFATLLLLGMVFALMTFLWLTFYAIIAASAGDYLRRPEIRRSIEAMSGTVLIGLGLRIAAEQK